MSPDAPESPSIIAAREAMTGPGEAERIAEIDELQIREGGAHPALDAIVEQVMMLLDVPIASVTIVLEDVQWFRTYRGLPVDRTPREVAFCTHVVASKAPLVVSDARTDPLFRDNPLIEDPGVVAYAGAPLRTARGHVVGTLCAIDHKVRDFDQDDVALLEALADRVAAELELLRERDGPEDLVNSKDLYSPAQFERIARIEARRSHRGNISFAMAVYRIGDGADASTIDIGAWDLTGWIVQDRIIGRIVPDRTGNGIERSVAASTSAELCVLEPTGEFGAWFAAIGADDSVSR